MKFSKKYITLILSVVSLWSAAQPQPPKEPIDWPNAMQSEWVNSQMAHLTLQHMIAQLFWIAVPANASAENLKPTINLIQRYHPGGIVFFKSTPIFMRYFH